MIRISPRTFAAFAIAAGFATASLPALADDGPEPQPAFTSEGRPSAAGIGPASPAEVASISPTNLAGLLNYCVETELVSHDDGDSVQTALNAKTNAVPMDQNGNVDYAIGSAGQLSIAGKATSVPQLDTAAQGKVCSAVLARSKSMI